MADLFYEYLFFFFEFNLLVISKVQRLMLFYFINYSPNVKIQILLIQISDYI